MLNEVITDLVCEVYRCALDTETVRPGDDFFRDLGGDSLSLAEVVSSIYDLLHIDIMEAMTTSATPSSLALFIAPRLQQAGGQLWPEPTASVVSESLVQAAKRVREIAALNVDEVAPA